MNRVERGRATPLLPENSNLLADCRDLGVIRAVLYGQLSQKQLNTGWEGLRVH
jgi:hypothetical protein